MAPSRMGLNDFPDSLLCLILTRVPLDQAIRCSVLSKRWKLLWRFLPILDFSDDMLYSSARLPSARLPEIQNIIDGILKLHSVSLEAFDFHGVFTSSISSAKIDEWIHHAALKDVTKLRLQFRRVVAVPTSVFTCCKLRSLTLMNFSLENMHGSFSGFPCLVSLFLVNIKLNDKTLELMLPLCPVLRGLFVLDCHGLQRVKICSTSLLLLKLDFPPSCNEIKAITAKCPRLCSLTIQIMHHVEKMEFELPICSDLSTTVSRLEPFTALKSLMKVAFLNGIYEGNVSNLHQFPYLTQICIDNARYLARNISGAAPLLKNLEQAHLNVASLNDAIPLLAYLLQHAPAMKTLIVSRQQGFDGALEFVNMLFNLPRASKEAKILLSLKNFKGSE
ncbi:FBD-associated F-box protein At1g66310-like isoform X2 [Cryptomeria japonica]|uniref:FBD-associated F-box protein At1g66310-like isoform X2 n=1 Tax=Cryptomeria japonica TaxID=3369 RepID=UPI0027DA176D|nr:FBD-associated F-box protein At1g66310-like isoform X2 [Cryptomeria japonica]